MPEPVLVDEEPTDPSYLALGETLARPRTFDGPRWSEPIAVDLVADPLLYVRVREPGHSTVRLEEWLSRHATGAAWDGMERVWRVWLEVEEVTR